MRDIALAVVPAAAPPNRGALLRQLADVRVPLRSAALLGDGTADPAAEGPATLAIRAALATLAARVAGGIADSACYQSDVARLVGLGPGLTPSGDDLLVALVATSRRLAAGGLVRAEAADQLAAAVAMLPAGRTTAVAHHLLSETAGGLFPAPLAALVGALGDPGIDHPTLSTLVDQLAATGAHSGADWIAGVIALTRVCLAQGGDACPIA